MDKNYWYLKGMEDLKSALLAITPKEDKEGIAVVIDGLIELKNENKVV